jgi:hypothetical protein
LGCQLSALALLREQLRKQIGTIQVDCFQPPAMAKL